MFINLGPVFDPGRPTESTYIEELTLALKYDLGLHLAQRIFWHSPSKLPAPLEWVGVRRIRLKPSVEHVLWFSTTPYPKADNRKCLKPYSASAKRALTGKRVEAQRPSGHRFGTRSFTVDNGGAIAPTLISASNSASNDPYHRAARAAGINAHPAIMPVELPHMAISMCTDEGDLVLDPFFGSGTVGRIAEDLNRRWIGFERSLHYINGAMLRFPNATRLAFSS